MTIFPPISAFRNQQELVDFAARQQRYIRSQQRLGMAQIAQNNDLEQRQVLIRHERQSQHLNDQFLAYMAIFDEELAELRKAFESSPPPNA